MILIWTKLHQRSPPRLSSTLCCLCLKMGLANESVNAWEALQSLLPNQALFTMNSSFLTSSMSLSVWFARRSFSWKNRSSQSRCKDWVYSMKWRGWKTKILKRSRKWPVYKISFQKLAMTIIRWDYSLTVCDRIWRHWGKSAILTSEWWKDISKTSTIVKVKTRSWLILPLKWKRIRSCMLQNMKFLRKISECSSTR